MSTRKRGRITVQSQPTGATRAIHRAMGVVQAIFGLVFVVMALTQIIPYGGLIGVPFLAVGALFTGMGILTAVGKNGLAHRVGYDVETGVEEETIVGLLDEVDRESREPDDPYAGGHIESTGPSIKARLEQLQSLKAAGLLTPQEYEESRKKILREL